MTKKAAQEILTQEYLDSRLDRFEDLINVKFMDFEQKMDRRMTEIITSTLDKLYRRIDPLLGEIEDNREDRIISTEKLEDHEKRLKKLENN